MKSVKRTRPGIFHLQVANEVTILLLSLFGSIYLSTRGVPATTTTTVSADIVLDAEPITTSFKTEMPSMEESTVWEKLTTGSSKDLGVSHHVEPETTCKWKIRLMEEILHHLGCIKP